MALIFLGSSKCSICNKVLNVDDEVIGLPPISDTGHPLYKYFDTGIHKSCYETWDKKEEIEALANKEKQDYRNEKNSNNKFE